MWLIFTSVMLFGFIERVVLYTAIPKSVVAFVENEVVPDVLETPPVALLEVSIVVLAMYFYHNNNNNRQMHT